MLSRPKGPSPAELIFRSPKLLRSPFTIFLEWRDRYGDVVSLPVRRPATLILNSPDDIRHVLATNPQNYRKTGGPVIGKRLLGQGLLASGEPIHSQQRHIIQPSFHRQAVSSFVDMIQEETQKQINSWKPGSIVDVFREMVRLTLAIIGKAYFSTDFADVVDELYTGFDVGQRFMQRPLNFVPESIPTQLHRRYKKATISVDRIMYDLIRSRRTLEKKPNDLLTTLVEARDADGKPLSEQQIRDDIVNIILAGHETTANALAWTWYLLSQHPRVEERMHTEIATVFDGRGPTEENLPRLQYTEMVFDESMRLYPPAWILSRLALNDDELDSGVRIPKGTIVNILPYVAHRNSQYFPHPDKFDPERFAPEARRARPSFVYLPFGGGPRGCIGETFARTEALIILSTVAQQFVLREILGHTPIPEPLITLRPKSGIVMRIVQRQQATSSTCLQYTTA